MDKAKTAVQGFLSKSGKDDTTVHESTNQAVQHEHITRTQHNESQAAVDREVHQDHHHTTVQPIQHHEVLPEKHTHQVAPTEHRTFEHGNEDHTRQRLEKERAQFQDKTEVGSVQHSHGKAAALSGEHVHHHVHENIQPVIQKETVQPSVVHTTKPIHEVHHNEAKHHGTSTLPAMSMDDFKKHGGALGGAETRHDKFAGSFDGPLHGRPIGGEGAQGTTTLTAPDGKYNQSHRGVETGSYVGHAGYADNRNVEYGSVGESTHKPSLMDKLNPKKDADGDGKAGFMS
ncbi:hypothetical protein BD289DRAFT_468226 [Coniella lustricola]|uniref:Allergen n=1 Tax=Coniella lustricola TaxID=2025994 RepID=A0A2T3A398_9PEZI|nr:hypothetical protein BD289DRAFT_468226 [Coniella lustricola]